jgi:CheY-like chemotaxis protein
VVLDDQAMMVEATSRVLKSFFDEATIQKFTDPVQALRHLDRLDPDLLTLDWNMPELTGDDVLDFLSQKRVTYPILLITACAEEIQEQVAKYKGRGLNLSLVAKPFTRDDLLSRVPVHCGDRAEPVSA